MTELLRTFYFDLLTSGDLDLESRSAKISAGLSLNVAYHVLKFGLDHVSILVCRAHTIFAESKQTYKQVAIGQELRKHQTILYLRCYNTISQLVPVQYNFNYIYYIFFIHTHVLLSRDSNIAVHHTFAKQLLLHVSPHSFALLWVIHTSLATPVGFHTPFDHSGIDKMPYLS